jgi:phosphoglucomutase
MKPRRHQDTKSLRECTPEGQYNSKNEEWAANDADERRFSRRQYKHSTIFSAIIRVRSQRAAGLRAILDSFVSWCLRGKKPLQEHLPPTLAATPKHLPLPRSCPSDVVESRFLLADSRYPTCRLDHERPRMASTADITNLERRIESAVADGRLSAGAEDNMRRWLTEPQYAAYAKPIGALVEADRFDELDRLFWEVVPFGTGGRRGPMAEFGSATINPRTIAESAHGLVTYYQSQSGRTDGKAVVACDTRNRSIEFARLAATTFAAHGMQVFLFEEPRSTPELSFAVRHLGCDIGVVISASHNPPADNGFKAYWSNGAQVLSPHDQGIIDCVYDAGEIPTVDFDAAIADGRIEFIGETIDNAYVEAVLACSLSDARDIPAIFTPLHGVGETCCYRVLEAAGFEDVEIFEPQRSPDGNFTNVPDQLPNPERRQVFEPAIEHVQNTDAALILASDPDADRLAVCVRDNDGEFVHLTGNKVAALLADYILRKQAAAGKLTPAHYVVETLVTTPLVATLAKSHGVRAIDDLLVGFKYIAETMDREGPDKFLFGCEESLGYLSGEYARDKDAGIAALYIMESAAELRRDGKTLLDRLDELSVAHGYHTEGQRSEVCTGSRGRAQIDGLMQTFRESPPTELAGFGFVRVRDYDGHEVRSLPDNQKTNDLPQPAGDLLFLESADEATRFSIAVRPSGTEPKIKFYFFAVGRCDSADQLTETKARTDAAFANVQDALTNWVRGVLDTQ